MIKDLVNNRYSGRIWENKPILQEKIDYIVDCALKAPSKQCLYPWQLHVITDSRAGKQFKDNLFWNDTWCTINGGRTPPDEIDSKDKRYNGQYRAPVLLVWTDRNPDSKISKDSLNFQKKENWSQIQAIVDATVSSSFAMLAAEEQGLQTSFGRCHPEKIENSVLGNDKKFYIAVGIGYAPINPNDPGEHMLTPIKRNGEIDGFETKNMDQNWPVKNHSQRNHIPSRDHLLQII